jgi:hypothetical protein
MSIDLELTPKTKRVAGEPCCQPVVYPDVERDQAARMAVIAKAKVLRQAGIVGSECEGLWAY